MGTQNGIRKGIQRPPEENIMAILDVIGVKEPEDIKDDKLSFLEAVRAISIIPETAEVPTKKMYEAVFEILRENKSLELIFSSYRLLNDLEKRFPRVSVAKVASTSTDVLQTQLVINSEVWSPFLLSSENDFTEMEGVSAADGDPIDCSKIFFLTRDIAAELCDGDLKAFGGATEFDGRSQQLCQNVVAKILMFQYLVSVLERDFLSRWQVFKTNQEWPVVRDSFLNQLLGSRRMNFKNLVKYSLCIMAAKVKECSDNNHRKEPYANSIFQKPSENFDSTFSLAEAEFRHTVCLSVQTFLILIMELDVVKKEADKKGRTSRSDGSRTPVLDIVIDQLTYDKELITPVLQAITEPKWKMNVILMYFLKHSGRCISRVLGTNIEPTNLDDIFKCFAHVTNVRGITKGIGVDVIQLLLAHGFQAYLSLQQHARSDSFVSSSREEKGLLKGTCKSFITAFKNLQSSYRDMELITEGKEALFTAATIVSCA